MDTFTVSLAGIPIGVLPAFAETESFFQDYICDKSPIFTVSASSESLVFERKQAVEYRTAMGYPDQIIPDSYLERLALLRLIANRLPDYDTVLFHGAIVALDGKAYLFAAPSGTGKSTHLSLWLKQFPQAYILNGDKPFLKVEPSGRVLACGTPWRGKEKDGINEILPLEAICFLDRSEKNQIRPVSFSSELAALLHQTHIPSDPPAMMKALHLVDRIGQNVRLFRLDCNMDPEAAQVSSQAMIPTWEEVHS